MSPKSKTLQTLLNGLKMTCPQCGKTPLFVRWGEVHKACAECKCELRAREGDCWFFMYITTAFITGLFILVMVLMTPANHDMGRAGLAAGALLTIVLTVPRRKGMAIAIDYLVDSRLENPRHPAQQ
ncbi:MAG: DUF983 domain-containing protein [Bdellovibrionaceae bacterium]|nr:DUF983 domain-containing protein [Bdellovibrionales bacterium]MCB9254540.1 DUF983 domain-containing protein [Pseudobdellovibrionaceae bacterium]